MKPPHPSTILALVLADRYREINPGCFAAHAHSASAITATRVVSIAQSIRKLVELGCNAELTQRQEKRRDSLERRADALLKPYGLCLGRPWGLCHYACPVGLERALSESECVFLA